MQGTRPNALPETERSSTKAVDNFVDNWVSLRPRTNSDAAWIEVLNF